MTDIIDTLPEESVATDGAGLSDEEAEKYIDTAILAGELMLSNGAETIKCEETMNYILSSSDADDYSANVLIPSIFARIGKYTKFVKAGSVATDFNKVVQTNNISRSLSCGKIDVFEAYSTLQNVKSSRLYPFWVQFIGYILILCALPVFYGGGVKECLSGVLAAVLMTASGLLKAKIRTREFVMDLLQIFIITFVAHIVAYLTKNFVNPSIIIITCLYAVLPGLVMTNSVRDIIHGNYISGNSRMMMASVKTLAIVGGAVLGMVVSSLILPPDVIPGFYDATYGMKWYVLAIVSYIVAFGYGIIQEVPWKYIAITAAIGCIGRLIYSGTVYLDLPDMIGVFAASAIITALSHISARIAKAPASLFFVSGVMALLPGFKLYDSISIMLNGEFLNGLESLFGALVTAGAISFGIFLVDVLVDAGVLAKRKELIKK